MSHDAITEIGSSYMDTGWAKGEKGMVGTMGKGLNPKMPLKTLKSLNFLANKAMEF